jgi:hypothetical protein
MYDEAESAEFSFPNPDLLPPDGEDKGEEKNKAFYFFRSFF